MRETDRGSIQSYRTVLAHCCGPQHAAQSRAHDLEARMAELPQDRQFPPGCLRLRLLFRCQDARPQRRSAEK